MTKYFVANTLWNVVDAAIVTPRPGARSRGPADE